MAIIKEYKLTNSKVQDIEMPVTAEPLTIKTHKGQLRLWVGVELGSNGSQMKTVRVVKLTVNPPARIPTPSQLPYIYLGKRKSGGQKEFRDFFYALEGASHES